jgi:ribosomal protein S18 acetylase RimI-like enzyme
MSGGRLLRSLRRRTQALGPCRALGRRLFGAIGIHEASAAETAKILARVHPGSHAPAPSSSPGVTNLVACRNGRAIGFVQLVRFKDEALPFRGHWLFSLHVLPAWRGLGVGKALSRQVMEMSRGEGAAELSLLVHSDNRVALAMYAKLGFAPAVIPGLEEMPAEGWVASGRRRLVLRHRFGEPGTKAGAVPACPRRQAS